METKLTLKLDSVTISRAKRYISTHRRHSLSRLVENYFNSLTGKRTDNDDAGLPPIVSGLAGIAKVGKGGNVKDDYTDYLVEKYK
jgi:hypothetical protein